MPFSLILATLVLTRVIHAFPFSDSLGGYYLHRTILSRADGRDPEDLSHIKTWAALGDSYAAGIGAGKRLGNQISQREAWLCSRWDLAYPVLMNDAEHFGDGPRDFQFLACSGWTSTQVKDDQVPKLADNSQQLITLSVGGNDVYLSDLLDACVYQISAGAILQDKCQEMIDKTSNAIDNQLGGWLNDLYNALKPKLASDGKIFQTGYAQFWDAETDQCDDVSWGVWNMIGHSPGREVHLTKDNRKQMNDLTIKVNNKIKETIIKNGHGDRMVFVDIDPYVRLLQGRFCERGIKEPAINRPGLLFYNKGTIDEEPGHDEFKRGAEEMGTDTFEGQVAAMFENTIKEHPDWILYAEEQDEGQTQAVGNAKASGFQEFIASSLPDTLKRIFHPRPFLHGIMAQLTLFHIVNDRAHSLGMPYAPQILRAKEPSVEYCNRGPVGPPQDLQCFSKPYVVPKEKTKDGSTSVVDAIKQFCKNRHGQKATAENFVYDRWDVTVHGVPKRQSLWLRASPASSEECKDGGRVWERNCLDVLMGGMNECSKNTQNSNGFKARGENCLDYMVDMGASVHEGDPPWDQHVVKYPPPESVKPFDMQPACEVGQEGRREMYFTPIREGQWGWDEANRAIGTYCNNDWKIGGPQLAIKDGNIRLWATSLDWWEPRGRHGPYEKSEWCQDFDYEYKNSDDCKYGFRKLLNAIEDRNFGYWYYRCVGYYVMTYDPLATQKQSWIEDGAHHAVENWSDGREEWPVFLTGEIVDPYAGLAGELLT